MFVCTTQPFGDNTCEQVHASVNTHLESGEPCISRDTVAATSLRLVCRAVRKETVRLITKRALPGTSCPVSLRQPTWVCSAWVGVGRAGDSTACSWVSSRSRGLNQGQNKAHDACRVMPNTTSTVNSPAL